MRTKSAEQALIAAHRNHRHLRGSATIGLAASTISRAIRPKARSRAFTKKCPTGRARRPSSRRRECRSREWIAEGEAVENALKAADAAIAKLQADCMVRVGDAWARYRSAITIRPDPMCVHRQRQYLARAQRRPAVRAVVLPPRGRSPANGSSARTRAATSLMARSRHRSIATLPCLQTLPAGPCICRVI